MRRADIITGIILLVLSGAAIVESHRMEYLIDGVPGPGFLPLWTCIFIAGLALYMLIKALMSAKTAANSGTIFPRQFFKNSAILLGGSAVAVALSNVLGMLACIGLLTGFLSWTLGHKKRLTCIAMAVVTPLIFWLVFTLALEIQFPVGLLGF